MIFAGVAKFRGERLSDVICLLCKQRAFYEAFAQKPTFPYRVVRQVDDAFLSLLAILNQEPYAEVN